MILKMYTVYDSKVNAYLQPFFMKSNGEALRAWEESCNDNKTSFYKYPQDFTLFEIGIWDDSTGSTALHDAKFSLGTALEFKRIETQQSQLPLPSEYHARA